MYYTEIQKIMKDPSAVNQICCSKAVQPQTYFLFNRCACVAKLHVLDKIDKMMNNTDACTQHKIRIFILSLPNHIASN